MTLLEANYIGKPLLQLLHWDSSTSALVYGRPAEIVSVRPPHENRLNGFP